MSLSTTDNSKTLSAFLRKAHRTHHFPFEFRELEGRLIEIDITTGKFDPTLYNHKFGTGAAERVIKELRKKYP
jgi:hypothetical protein